MTKPNARKSILLIDDHQQRKTELSSRLRMQGYTIDIATGGFHGVHLMEKNSYDLVMMIDDMSDLSTQETVGLIKATAQKKNSDIPVMVMRSVGKELDDDEIEFIKQENVSQVTAWHNEFRTLLRQITANLS
tara:strand:- start:182 stop:577 length:396 start_codon:yes stop_codon:yes gene_type:complete